MSVSKGKRGLADGVGNPRRMPVIRGAKVRNDRNRRLMLKFKYGTITPKELDDFHELVKNIIYKAMHRNKSYLPFEDLYHDIWQKIVRFRHTWNQNRDTFVSTWLTIVANSVINTSRRRETRRRARTESYEDFALSRSADAANPPEDDAVFRGEDTLSNSDRSFWWGDYDEAKKTLSEDGRRLLDKIEENSSEMSSAGKCKWRKILRRIASELGWEEEYAFEMVDEIRRTMRDLPPF